MNLNLAGLDFKSSIGLKISTEDLKEPRLDISELPEEISIQAGS